MQRRNCQVLAGAFRQRQPTSQRTRQTVVVLVSESRNGQTSLRKRLSCLTAVVNVIPPRIEGYGGGVGPSAVANRYRHACVLPVEPHAVYRWCRPVLNKGDPSWYTAKPRAACARACSAPVRYGVFCPYPYGEQEKVMFVAYEGTIQLEIMKDHIQGDEGVV